MRQKGRLRVGADADITIFDAATVVARSPYRELALDQVVSTEGDWPRSFSLDPPGRWLLVANQCTRRADRRADQEHRGSWVT